MTFVWLSDNQTKSQASSYFALIHVTFEKTSPFNKVNSCILKMSEFSFNVFSIKKNYKFWNWLFVNSKTCFLGIHNARTSLKKTATKISSLFISVHVGSKIHNFDKIWPIFLLEVPFWSLISVLFDQPPFGMFCALLARCHGVFFSGWRRSTFD